MPTTSACGESYLVSREFLQSLKSILTLDASSTATAEIMSIAALQETANTSQISSTKKGLSSISTSAKPGAVTSSTKTSKTDLYDAEDEGMGRGKKGKNKKMGGKATRLAVAEEEPVDMASSKGNKKGGKRGKDKETTKTASSSGDQSSHSTSSSSVAADKNKEADVAASLIAPFIAKPRLMELCLRSCPVTFTEVEEGLSALSSSSDSDGVSNYDSDDTGTILPLFEAIYTWLLNSAMKEYRLAAERAVVSTTQGTHDTRMKRELNRDQKFEEYWTNLQVSSKVLLSFEKDCTPDTPLYDQLFYIHSFLLATKCAPIATMLTEFCCWEHDVACPVLEDNQSSLSFEQRRQLQKDLPQVGGVGNWVKYFSRISYESTCICYESICVWLHGCLPHE